MSNLEEALLRPTSSDVEAPPNGLGERGARVPALGDEALRQIRSILIDAGVTAAMMGLPGDSLDSVGGTTTSTTLTSDDGAEAGMGRGEGRKLQKGRRESLGRAKSQHKSRLMRSLSERAERKARFAGATKENPLNQGIYTMFFMSRNWSLPFWYSVFTFCGKMALFGIVLYWIFRPDGWRDEMIEEHDNLGGTPILVRATQFLLIPTAIGITEELLITASLISKVRWTELDDNPQATRLKFFISNAARAVDGLTWLFIIAFLMVYAVDVLNMFLNFAALQFLQSVDNVAYDLAKEGFLSLEFERLTEKIADTSLPSARRSWREYLDTIIIVAVYLAIVALWAVVNFAEKLH